MVFNSLDFLLFFLCVLLVFALVRKHRWLVLLVSSYFFYAAWRWEYLLLIVASTLIDYGCARGMAVHASDHIRRRFLWASLVANLGMLFAFKYFNFFVGIVSEAFPSMGAAHLSLLLPVGISFYTFQTLSYSIDVYHRRIPPERHLGLFALYVTYFPQLVAGPIERAGNLLQQFRHTFRFEPSNLYQGAQRIAWGLFKKVVIADRLALLVDPLFQQPDHWSSLSLALGAVLFGMQIYCDFSGYTDMAIGLSRCFNVRLSQNFDRPYFSRSLADFWNRWHITLSRWFRDYVYIPLGGNRVVKWRMATNIGITFLLSGLWHGAAWTFVIWGLIHGAFLLIERVVFGKQRGSFFQAVLTFSVVHLAWVFFRAEDLSGALVYLEHLGAMHGGSFRGEWQASGVSKLDFVLAMGLTAAVYLKELIHGLKKPFVLKLLFYLAVGFGILVFAVDEGKAFIYFQF